MRKGYERCPSLEDDPEDQGKNRAWMRWRGEYIKVICAGVVAAAFFLMILL